MVLLTLSLNNFPEDPEKKVVPFQALYNQIGLILHVVIKIN